MTKKDYKLIADVLNRNLDNGDNDMIDGIQSIDKLVHDFCKMLKEDNPKFDYIKFLRACGITQ